MASSKKGTTGKKTSAAKKRSSTSSKRNTRTKSQTKNVRASGSSKKTQAGRRKQSETQVQTYVDYSLYVEIFLWILIALSVFCFISMLGFGGAVGRTVASVIGGLFGIMGYVFPFAVLLLCAFLISNNGSPAARIKTVGAVILYITLCAVMQLLLVGYEKTYTLAEYYTAGQIYHTGGGAAGGLLVSFFGGGIGYAGTWVILIMLLIISMILLTQRSVIRMIRRAGSRAANSAQRQRESYAKARESYKQDQRERRLKRELEKAYAADEAADDTKVQDTSKRRSRIKDQQLMPADAYDPDSLSEDMAVIPGTVRRRQVSRGVTTDTDLGLPVSGKKAAGRFFPELSFHEEETEDADKLFAEETPVEPDAMKKLRGSVKQEIHPEPLPDDLFKNAFSKGNALQEDAEKKPLEMQAEEPASAQDPANSSMAGTNHISADTSEGEAEKGTVKRRHASQEEIQTGIDHVAAEIEQQQTKPKPVYHYPSVNLLQKPSGNSKGTTESDLRETAAKLQQVLQTFGVQARITDVTCGPSVTRYELQPEMGVKVSKIVNLQDDIKLNLAAQDIRIEAPIPGKAAVGIEVPNKKATGVMLRELIDSDEFQKHPSKLAYAVGRDIAGNIIVADIAKMPHLLIAGATGSGKSVFINTLIMSILYKAKPDEVKLILIDPKVVELSVYNGIPHLLIPVVTDPKKAAGALNWAVAEMMKRYQMFSEAGVRDLKGYNKRVEQLGDDLSEETKPEKLPQIVVVVDELADLMMVASNDVEDAICRLAQLARAAGIHLVIATQRPSVDVITGLIKANMPSRIAFSVSSGVDSRTILDQVGAEKLLGNGDMLFAPQTYKQPLRVQGAFVSDNEVAAVTEFLKENNQNESHEQEMEQIQESMAKVTAAAAGGGDGDVDELFAQAGTFIIGKDKASIGMLQRWFKIGFNRAARIMDQLAEAGVVGPEEGTKPRKILMSEEQFQNYLEQN